MLSKYSFTLFSQRVTDASGFVSLVDTVHNGFFFQQQNMGQISNVGLTASSTFVPAPWLETSVQLNGYYSRFTSSYAEGTKGAQYAKPSLYIETNHTVYFNRSKTFASELNLWYQAPQQLGYDKERAQYNLGVANNVRSTSTMVPSSIIFTMIEAPAYPLPISLAERKSRLKEKERKRRRGETYELNADSIRNKFVLLLSVGYDLLFSDGLKLFNDIIPASFRCTPKFNLTLFSEIFKQPFDRP